MSLENSITELAASIRLLAEGLAVNVKGQAAMVRLADQFDAVSNGGNALLTEQAPGNLTATKRVEEMVEQEKKSDAADAELEQAVAKVEADAKAEGKPTAKEAIQAALDKAKAESKKPAGAAAPAERPADTAGSAAAPDSNDAAPLDYTRDVQPKLLAYIKTHGKVPFQKLLMDNFGVDKAPALKPEQYQAVLELVA